MDRTPPVISEYQKRMKATTVREIVRKPYKTRALGEKQVRAIVNFTENGGNKSKAARDAGYSKTVIRSPDKLFGGVAVHEAVLKVLKTPDKALEKLERKVDARHLDSMTFPPYHKREESNGEVGEGEEGENDFMKTKGEQMTDEAIVVMLGEIGCVVRKVVHGDMARHVYFWNDDSRTQLEAIDMVINLFGLYAPKRVEQKTDLRVGIFSMAELRRKMKENGIEVIPDSRGAEKSI